MVQAIIIDDERIGRETLESLIGKYCPTVNVIAVADSVRSGWRAIDEHHPDLVFLDIEMPNGSGMELLKNIGEPGFEVIFTTAYQQYAIQAIKLGALDYLLKPIDRDDLIAAVRKVEKKLSAPRAADERLDTILRGLTNATGEHRKLALPTDEGLIMVHLHDIVRCEADGNYTHFVLSSGETLLISRTLKEYDRLLSSMDFIRVHNSHLVNLDHVKRYKRGEGGEVVMSDNREIPVSRRKKNELIRRLGET